MLSLLERAAKKGGEVLRHYHTNGVDLQARAKDHPNNLVTEADLKSQAAIRETILAEASHFNLATSEIGFIGEEDLQESNTYTFIIDPLDGTGNFASGFGYFAISVACFKEGKPYAGVIYDPLKDIIYKAEKGKGASRVLVDNTQTLLHVQPKKINESFLVLYLPSDPKLRKQNLEQLDKLISTVRTIRILGSICMSHALLVDNIADIVVYSRSGIWDVAAADTILHESGAVLTDWNGQPLQYDLSNHDQDYPNIASHPQLLPEVLALMK